MKREQSMVGAAFLQRAGDLKGELVEFSQQPRYERAASAFLEACGHQLEELGEHELILLWDCFVLEHTLANGRTVVEQFVAANPQLTEPEREMVLGWRDVVQGPFQVLRRDGPALLVRSLVDELTYRVRSNMGPGIFRRTPRGWFIIARLVAVGDEWMLSGPLSVLPAAERDFAYELAMDLAVRMPEAAFRNPAKLALAWEQQRTERDRFIRFFGDDVVVIAGENVQDRMDDFVAFCRAEILGRPEPDGPGAPAIPLDILESETVGLIYDETDGLGFYAEFGLVEQAFTDPGLLRRRRWREQTRVYLHDDTVEPMVLRRLAERDPQKASVVFRRLLKWPRFEWSRDGVEMLRELKQDYYAQPPWPRVSLVSDQLTARRRPPSGNR
ncbi:hypothetical protein HH310_36785 [Actinoplanes sp. TBRC 11911]|uniref:hypothetical protein n=1 Tax=Actinoplanes sp. TBRC 11911 TaxID=2729386 RepID=UPI00145D4226|nr:hypothetical protein [Actinoplanes sp. TBRC 11911]NMO56717.1 hypothetical protein [Actinoplanes sp. TBRC 11911]